MTRAKALTEEQWLECGESYVLLRHLQHHCLIGRARGGKRKLRLFAAGCCRQAWHLFDDERCRRAVEVVERLADAEATPEEQSEAMAGAQAVVQETNAEVGRLAAIHRSREMTPERWAAASRRCVAGAAEMALMPWLVRGVQSVASSVTGALAMRTNPAVRPELDARQAELVRDLFGDPFCPAPALEPAWRSETVLRVAQAIYTERRWTELPVLADALEEAGCSDAVLLAHCRGGGEHARGCWLVDLLLARE
jgi:hypothetical protein